MEIKSLLIVCKVVMGGLGPVSTDQQPPQGPHRLCKIFVYVRFITVSDKILHFLWKKSENEDFLNVSKKGGKIWEEGAKLAKLRIIFQFFLETSRVAEQSQGYIR